LKRMTKLKPNILLKSMNKTTTLGAFTCIKHHCILFFSWRDLVEDHDDILLTIFQFESSLKYKIVPNTTKSSTIIWISLVCIAAKLSMAALTTPFLIHDTPSQRTITNKESQESPMLCYAIGSSLCHNGCFDTLSQMYKT
jgi:hypothetical protein